MNTSNACCDLRLPEVLRRIKSAGSHLWSEGLSAFIMFTVKQGENVLGHLRKKPKDLISAARLLSAKWETSRTLSAANLCFVEVRIYHFLYLLDKGRNLYSLKDIQWVRFGGAMVV